ncbi:hypothetical protein AMS68_001468 [Peltaster fructicola]|uniref:Uncharacterized protein n=1 Tax=Peltaster fructicola TaxID=286661 RepID=A0A6H0XMT1_9PEZI|nr:hypothetical protein AMS68_001468 [Peltaster fructicola]
MGSYGNNITIIEDLADWQLLWPDGLANFQLDIVGFLAILGEASILANAQVSALSRLFYLPRLLPAPQALLRVTRPETLPPTEAHVTAVRSGNNKKSLNHVASVLLATHRDELRKWSVRCVKVSRTKAANKLPTWFDHVLRGTTKQTSFRIGDNNNNHQQELIPTTVKAKAAGPLAWVTLLGFSLTLIIFIISLRYGDGMSLVALVALSGLSTICGIANKWELSLPQRPKDATESEKDQIVIRYPEGSFLVVNCDENIARELFFAPEEINYAIKSPTIYRILALVGSVMLMFGVILLANARLQLQMAWAGAYLILNAAHWAAAALPAKAHWDLSAYEVQEESIARGEMVLEKEVQQKNGASIVEGEIYQYGGPYSTSFTEALYKVILFTKRTRWTKLNESPPATETWTLWLQEALAAAKAAESTEDGKLVDPLPGWNHNNGVGTVHSMVAPNVFHPKKAFNKLAALRLDDEPDESTVETGGLRLVNRNTVAGAEQLPNGHVETRNGEP